jgi:hypothetical protein
MLTVTCSLNADDLTTGQMDNSSESARAKRTDDVRMKDVGMSRFFEATMPQCFYPANPVQSMVSLLLFLLAQAEIITEHGLERFTFSMFKVTNVRRTNRPESGSNFFNVRALSPDRER